MINKLDWEQLDTLATGLTMEEATKRIFKEVVIKLNEVIEALND